MVFVSLGEASPMAWRWRGLQLAAALKITSVSTLLPLMAWIHTAVFAASDMAGIIYYLRELPKGLPRGAHAYEKLRLEVAVQLAVERLGSIKAVAEKLEVSRAVIYNWTGKTSGGIQKPNRDNLRKLARLLSIPLDMLLD